MVYIPKNGAVVLSHQYSKGGNSSELNNFRGIAVSSCISKLFTKIINAQLVEYCEQKKIFSSNQFGFMNSCRTDDNNYIRNEHFNYKLH